jgi:hypothetical protein
MAAIVGTAKSNGATSSGGNIATAAASFTSGNTLIAFVTHEGSATTVSVSDPTNGAWTPLTYRSHSNGDMHGRIFYMKNITGGSYAVTATYSANRVYRSIDVFEVSGLDLTTPVVDEEWGQAASGTSSTVSPAVTTEPGIVILGPRIYSTSASWSVSAGYTLTKNSNATMGQLVGIAYKTIASAGSETPGSATTFSVAQMALAVALRDASTGGGITETDGAAAGVGAGTGVSGSTNIVAGSAAGVATGSGVAAAVVSSVGASAGTGSVAGTTQALAATVGSSDGAATVSGVGALTATTVSSSSGTGSATGVSGATSGSPGAADGVATVSGVGALTATTVFSSDGASTVAGVGENANTSTTEEADAAAAGASTVAGVGVAVFAADGSASGVASVSGEVGTHQLLAAAVTGVATGEGNLNVPTSVSLSGGVVGTITLTGRLHTESPVVWDTSQGMAGRNPVRDAKRLAQHDAEDLQDIFQMVANLWP